MNCPKCGKDMWDQKNGKFPWKPGTPLWKCKDKDCAKDGGVIWEPKPAKAAPNSAKTPAPAHSNVPDKQLPEELQTGTPEPKPRLDRLCIRAHKLILDEVVPLYVKAGIGCSDVAVAAMAATLFIAASKEG